MERKREHSLRMYYNGLSTEEPQDHGLIFRVVCANFDTGFEASFAFDPALGGRAVELYSTIPRWQ